MQLAKNCFVCFLFAVLPSCANDPQYPAGGVGGSAEDSTEIAGGSEAAGGTTGHGQKTATGGATTLSGSGGSSAHAIATGGMRTSGGTSARNTGGMQSHTGGASQPEETAACVLLTEACSKPDDCCPNGRWLDCVNNVCTDVQPTY